MMPTDSASSPVAARLRRRHHDLARRCLSAPIGADERQSFIDELVAAGSVLAPGRDRDAVRKLLYYWAADAASRGERPRDQPPPALQPYDGDGAPARPVDMAILTVESSSEDVEATTADTRSAIRIATLARQWLAENRNEGYLLTGEALKEADRIKTNDADIQMLVDASKDAEAHKARKWKHLLIGAVVGLALVVIVMGAGGVGLLSLNQDLQTAHYDLYEALAEQTAINRRNQEEARSALDALSRGRDDPLEPLKKLLRRLGDAQPEELARLQYRPPVSATAAPGDRIVVDPGAPIVRPAAVSLGTCDGVLWLGSDTAKLVNRQGPLAALEVGDPVTVNEGVNIRLRRDLPSAEYVMAPQAGLVPGGAVLVLTAEPVAYARPGGVQFFARVRAPRQYCTRVFVQYVGVRALADEALAFLRQLGVQASGAERVTKVPSDPEVRVFFDADLAVAEHVADRLRSFNNGKKLVVKKLYNFPAKPAPGTLEVWIALNW